MYRETDAMRLDPREELLPTVKSGSQALTWLRGALRWCACNCYKPITQPWPATGQARPGPVHAAILASFKCAANKQQADGTWKHDYTLSNVIFATEVAEFARVFKAEHR